MPASSLAGSTVIAGWGAALPVAAGWGAALLVAAGWGAALLAAGCDAALLPLHTERLRAEVGGFAVMNCRLDFPFGHEIPYHLEWDKDGESIFSWYSGDPEARVADRWGGRVRRVGVEGGVLGGGSINVSSVRETDAGLYHCRVSFPNRSPPSRNNGTFYMLDVDGGNLIVTPPRNATVLEGERAELECLPASGAAHVEWYREGADLRALPELHARADRPSNGSLVLRSATAADAGEYLCRVHAPDGRTQSAAAYLDVHYKAKVVYAPRERHLPFGKPASLDCHFSANPPLTNLRWEKDGFLFDPYNVPGVFYSRNGSLLFNQVDETHEGVYSCAPYNALGSAGASGGVRVRVQRPPTLVARPHPLYLTRLGSTVVLPCVALSHPPMDPPAVRWTRKDGAELPVGRHSLDGGNLTIVEVREEDRGTYECTASNEAAAVSTETDLVLENMPPRAPFGLVARPESRSLHLSWAPGHSGEEAEYEVWYRERDAGEWRALRLLSLGVTRATVEGLRPRTEYELRVLAQDQLGDGLFSKPLFVHTLGAEEEEVAAAASVTEGGDGAGGGADELEVSVRAVEGGALVRWERAPLDESRCSMRWYRGLPPHVNLLATYSTHHDHMLVRRVEEGGRYWARVECGAAAGGAGLVVPDAGRVRAALVACAGSALLLAVLVAALYLARRHLRVTKRNR